MSYGDSYDQGREQYGQGQGQGREQYGDQQYRGNYGASAPDFSGVVSHAENHGGSGSSFFNQAANYLQQQHGNISNQDIDQEHMVNSHQKFYGGGGGGNGPASSNELGAGAAMQALKSFTGGGGSGGGQNQLIGLAMAEAEKLFDQQSANGNAVSCSLLDLLKRVRFADIFCLERRQAVCYQLGCRDGFQDVHERTGWSWWHWWTVRLAELG